MPFLTWINDKDARNQAKNVPFHILKNAGTYGDPSAENLVVHGDNLLALRALLPFYRGKVKCIYIDPPYNTGSAFEHYDDNLEHSQWLSMIYPRLQLLREFLAEDGSIWVSIDDDEQAYMKVLLDEVFGRKNFIRSIVWQKRTSPDARLNLGDAHDYIIVYANNRDIFQKVAQKLPLSDSRSDSYKNPDNDPRGPWASVDLTGQVGHATPDQFYEITLPDGTVISPPKNRCWALAKSTFESLRKDNRIWFGTKGNSRPRQKKFLSEADGMYAWSWWTNKEVGHTQEAKKEIITVVSESAFDTPKPERLIQRILQIATNPGDLVLDSFLGSGTTAAVAHKMGRRYIGIEMGEHAKTHCIPRLQKVIDGEQGGISASVNWQGGGGFRFFELGEPAFDKWGCISPEVEFKTLAAFVWMSETGEAAEPAESPCLGVSNGTAYYLLYAPEGSSNDPSAGVLTFAAMQRLLKDHPFDGPKVVFAEACAGIAEQELKAHQITFKQIPTDLLQ